MYNDTVLSCDWYEEYDLLKFKALGAVVSPEGHPEQQWDVLTWRNPFAPSLKAGSLWTVVQKPAYPSHLRKC